MNPKLYVKTGCPYCRAALEYLDGQHISYERIDVLADPDRALELEEVSGQKKTPTLVIGDAVLADFGVEEAEPFLKEHGLLK